MTQPTPHSASRPQPEAVGHVLARAHGTRPSPLLEGQRQGTRAPCQQGLGTCWGQLASHGTHFCAHTAGDLPCSLPPQPQLSLVPGGSPPHAIGDQGPLGTLQRHLPGGGSCVTGNRVLAGCALCLGRGRQTLPVAASATSTASDSGSMVGAVMWHWAPALAQGGRPDGHAGVGLQGQRQRPRKDVAGGGAQINRQPPSPWGVPPPRGTSSNPDGSKSLRGWGDPGSWTGWAWVGAGSWPNTDLASREPGHPC